MASGFAWSRGAGGRRTCPGPRTGFRRAGVSIHSRRGCLPGQRGLGYQEVLAQGGVRRNAEVDEVVSTSAAGASNAVVPRMTTHQSQRRPSVSISGRPM